MRFIFEKAFTGRNGEGYPPERKEPQVRNAGILNQVKAAVVKENYLDTLRAIDPQLVKTAVSGPRFQQCFFENCQDKAKTLFARSSLNRHQGQRRWPFRRLFFLLFLLLRHAAAGRFGQMQAVDHPYQTDQGDKHKRQAEADPR